MSGVLLTNVMLRINIQQTRSRLLEILISAPLYVKHNSNTKG
jgi:hypothetical protein